MARRASIVALGLLCAALVASADEGWDAREARGIRAWYPAIDQLPDFAQIKETFEKGLAGDASCAAALAGLVKHGNQDVASYAAQMLGRFPSAEASAALKESYAQDARLFVRVNALAGLARMKDPATAPLAIAALEGDDEAMRGAALGALEALGDKTYSSAIVQYYERHPGEVSANALWSLGELGDPPGSTAVRDRLLGEANNKSVDFDFRYSAALGLKAMGLADLVKPILDIMDARDTYRRLGGMEGAMRRLSRKRGMTIKGQADVDALLRDVEVAIPRKEDGWQRPIRARFISEGVFHAVSDGPDKTSDTPDDLSTAEGIEAYLARVFPGEFQTP